MRLGMVTYNMGKDMDLPTLIGFCIKTGLEGVELRTTHKHGVELELTPQQRSDVRKRFEGSPVRLAGLGSTYEFQSPDPAVVKQNIDGAVQYAQLAADVGANGIKVRPNGIPDGVPLEKTLDQIGKSLRQVATFAEGVGVTVRVEVHGKTTCEPKNMRTILDHADHPNVVACWNSNPQDMDENKSIAASFDLLKKDIGHCHINEIGVYQYPWQDLFSRLKAMNYNGWCLAEIGYNPEPERFMKYYRTLFDLYTGRYTWPRA